MLVDPLGRCAPAPARVSLATRPRHWSHRRAGAAAIAAVVAITITGCGSSPSATAVAPATITIVDTVTVPETVTIKEIETVTETVTQTFDLGPESEESVVLLADSEPQTKRDITITLQAVVIEGGETTVFATLTNESDEPCDFGYVAELVADGRQYSEGSSYISELASQATTDTGGFYWEEEIPYDTREIRVIARCLLGGFQTGELLEFDVAATLE